MAQVDSDFVIRSERLGEVVLLGSSDDLDGAQMAALKALPAGFGDCRVMEWQAFLGPAATAATPTLMGLSLSIVDSNSLRTDFLGAQPFLFVGPSSYTCWRELYAPVLWRATEKMFLEFSELDTNAAPTMDLRLFVRVQRLRNLGGVSSLGPLGFAR